MKASEKQEKKPLGNIEFVSETVCDSVAVQLHSGKQSSL